MTGRFPQRTLVCAIVTLSLILTNFTTNVAQAASPATSPKEGDATSGKIAYVFRRDVDTAAFNGFLTGRGYGVTLVPLGAVLATDFSQFDLIIIGDDTGNLNDWGIPPATAAQVAQITRPNKPIIGTGEGGYAFFGQLSLFIGWPNGWHGPDNDLVRATPLTAGAVYASPNAIPADPVKVYGTAVNSVAIYLGGAGAIPSSVFDIGDETPDTKHAPLIAQSCRFLWGFGGNPSLMTPDGQNLFHNLVEYARTFQCATTTPPTPTDCVTLVKTSVPAAGTPVSPGDVIKYTISYTIKLNSVTGAPCNLPKELKLADTVPLNTIFVPGSATDGIAPAGDNTLYWLAAGTNTKMFSVEVQDTACRETRAINNRAGLFMPSGPPITSNVVTHPMKCPPIGFPNGNPPYAEDEVQINPYPIIAGHPTEVKVRLTNNTITPTTVVVSAQTSPDKFGIGMSFTTIASKTVTIPANSNVIVSFPITLAATGHYCIQIRVDIPGYGPIFTQRNLDVTEDLRPGVTDVLTFSVGNPTSTTADIKLVVVNTCPGWTAVPSPTLLTGMAPGEVRQAQLLTTPPNPVSLGSGCHIDVQGWLVDPATGLPSKLLGGIRKLDVPPVHLPPNVNPPWLEPEISTIPTPPVTGQPAQICVELQNPLAVPKTETVIYSVADFGAGIPFTPVATKTFTLPPFSIAKYCADWTPAPGGTLHRCILITLRQPGYRDMRSQRNINLRRVLPSLSGSTVFTFTIGNPDTVSHTLQLTPTLYGIKPFYKFVIRKPGGDPPPDIIGAGEQAVLIGLLLPAMQTSAQSAVGNNAAPDDYRFGDESRVDVAVTMDGASAGGFTVQYDAPQISLPIVIRKVE